MGKRAKAHYGMKEIATAAGVGYRTVLRHEREKRLIYGDLESVCRYIARHRLGDWLSNASINRENNAHFTQDGG